MPSPPDDMLVRTRRQGSARLAGSALFVAKFAYLAVGGDGASVVAPG